MYDWAHVYVNDGLADVELGQCMKHLQGARAHSTFAELGQYIDRFTLPKILTIGHPSFHSFGEQEQLAQGRFHLLGR